jgi:hypothetical protein
MSAMDALPVTTVGEKRGIQDRKTHGTRHSWKVDKFYDLNSSARG